MSKPDAPRRPAAFPPGERIVQPREMAQRLAVSVGTLYEWLARPTAGMRLPRPRQVGPRRVGWPSSEVDEFIRSLPSTLELPRANRRRPKI